MASSPDRDVHPRVLVVDDEPLIADSLVAILNDHRFEALAAYGGMDGLAKAEAFSPELLLTDVIMPGVDGIQLALQLCKRLPQCRVLFLSGHVSRSDVAAQVAGISTFGFVEKPIHPRDLLDQVRSILLLAEHPAVE